ncbi:hypothetical protein I588_02694 [Enterococcus pallens ATCC BAA-351]|uniref:Mga helix-turn-helix domain-containing protein n=2 Tax=Enterococcus pallens TaxID=160454 RepID=R2S6R4_9ENTE|nr:hypothetical protein UAU_04345 [Enterococcus pallens ATCC BAA-351]EOU17707.1 hypothetical protein I588_02694 [Enterococcus pallens ATCC BAA-351]OJG81583.1 hypothetical protein RV10_GL002822 [Enterococcus pallens]
MYDDSKEQLFLVGDFLVVKELMDTHYQKRYLLLEYLFHNRNTLINIKEFVKILNVSYPTVKKIIVEARQDIKEMAIEKQVQLSQITNQNYLYISTSEDFTIDLIRLYYLENSLRFKLFSLLLSSRKWTLGEITKKLDIAYSPLKKELLFLKTYIADFANNIFLRSNRKIFLEGDELTIRMLYTGIFQQVYGGYKWPFGFIHLPEIYELLDILSPVLYKKFTTRFTLINYGIAITLYRSQKNTIAENKYFWEPSSDSEQLIFNQFIHQLRQKVPTIPANELTIEARFLISCLLSNSLGYQDEEIPQFFKRSNVLKEIDFLGQIEEKVQNVEHYALSSFSDQERNTIFCRLIAVFYQILIFADFLKQKALDLYVYHPFEFYENHERERSFYSIIMEKYSKKQNGFEVGFVEYVCAAYYKILFFELDKRFFHPKIKVLIFSHKAPEFLLSTRLHDIFSHFYIEIVQELNEEVDLIISDMAISKRNLLNLPRRVPIVVIQSQESTQGCELLLKQLTRIADEKYRTSKGVDKQVG